MRAENPSFIGPTLFGVVVIATALVLTGMQDVIISSRGIVVLDTNTIRQHTPRIRLVGFDAPELKGHCEEERLLARRAQRRLEELASSPVVRIDLVNCAADLAIRYGRRDG